MNSFMPWFCRRFPAVIGLLLLLAALTKSAFGQISSADVADQAEPKTVKIYGAGGLRGLEAYQSGFLVSGEGHILTVWSYVLDSDVITIALNDGRKLEAQLVGMDPRLEIAVLKVDGMDFPHFNMDEAVALDPGARVLAFNNLYGIATGNEPSSVLHGIVTAKTDLAARSGAYETVYRGPVYVLDAMTNNPGAPGGALTDRRGRLAGILGKELKNAHTGTLLNYALPVSELVQAVEDIRAGKSRPPAREENAKKPKEAVSLTLLGIQLVPDFLERTPPFVEGVRIGSPAAKAGIKADDLVLFINGRIVQSCKLVNDELTFIDRLDEVRLTIQRGQELLDVTLRHED
ncbi:MAG: S1C family serine protease [Planctomycetales bacterium]|nr:S1C family serine protease [Planctomycetales bacterium]